MHLHIDGNWRRTLSQRRKELNALAQSPAAADHGDIMRRVLLGAVTALLVARPLVSGEDPGRLHSPESISGVILNLLWMITAILGAIWYARSPRSSRIKWAMPAALAIVALLIGVSAAVTHCYHHPAWLIFWEWATLPIIFLLTRELASDADPTDDSAGGLLAAVLASAVSLAAFGIYQSVAHIADLPVPDTAIEFSGAPTPDFDGLVPATESPIDGICRATFDRSESLVAVLLLALPAIAVFGYRTRGWRSRLGFGLVVLLIVGLVLGSRDLFQSSFLKGGPAGDAAAIAMVGEHPLFGVGPGNFSRHSPRLQPAGYPILLSEPGSAYLELASTGGVLALIALGASIAILAASFYRVRNDSALSENDVEAFVQPGPRWEFYLGGVFGLLLGLFLRLIDLPITDVPQSITGIAAVAVGRSLVWFLAFALFEGVLWRNVMRQKAIAIGLILVALAGCIFGSVLTPAVSQYFWAVAGIGLSVPVAVSIGKSRPPIARWSGAPLLAAVAVIYFALVCSPIYDSAMAMAEARREARLYPRFLDVAKSAIPGPDKRRRSQDIVNHIDKKIHKALAAATAADPYDTTPELEWSAWFYELWKIVPNANQEAGIGHARRAATLDPVGTEPLIREFQLRLLFAGLDTRHFRPQDQIDEKFVKRVAELREENFREARSLIKQIKERDPALEARLRFRLAQALISVNEPERYQQGLAEAEQVLKLDAAAPDRAGNCHPST